MGCSADLSFLDDHTVHVENEFVDLKMRALPGPFDHSRYLSKFLEALLASASSMSAA